MLDSARDFLGHDGLLLHLERRGRGSTHVLFAHGWISSRRMWYDVAARLDPERFTLHLLDFRGCGRSDRPRNGHDFDGYAGDLRAALASIEAPVTLVGHSMGGRLAQFIASEQPVNLARLMLVAPGTARPGRFSEQHRALTLDAFGSRVRIEQFQRAAMVADVSPESVERIVEDALVCQFEHWIGWYDRGRTLDFSDRLASINVPALVIAGENDPLIAPTRVKRDVASAIDAALFVALKNAGHNLPVEAPAEIATAVERFATD